jgi:hypothetical protein
MTFGERAALEGLLVALNPRLAIEVGTLNGGSLRRIAAHSQEVHAFDLQQPRGLQEECPNAIFHVGNSHELLPQVLADFGTKGQQVDFALIDGDASTLGVQADLAALLTSPAVTHAVLLVHDSLNQAKRAALESLSGVSYVDLDFVPGHVYKREKTERWGGFALFLVGDFRLAGDMPMNLPRWDHAVLADGAQSKDPRKDWGGDLILKLERSNRDLRNTVEKMQSSASWRLTEPLRAFKGWLKEQRA